MRQYRLFSYKDANYRICSPSFTIITEELKRLRAALELYRETDPAFFTSLTPLSVNAHAPEVARAMAEAALKAGVGPMAAVAGAFAEAAGRKALAEGADEAIVENGGDIFLASPREVIVGIFAGASPVSRKLALRITPDEMPLGLCASSSVMGHSLSLGNCDLALVVSPDTALADAAATFACNSVKTKSDIARALEETMAVSGVRGVLIVKSDQVGVAGNLPEFIPHTDPEFDGKVTRDRTNKEIVRLV